MARSYFPPGFRFHPTDEELLAYYLKKKVAGRRSDDGVIGEIELYKFEPADLPGLAILHSKDPEWFFFNAQDKKYLHGARTNRTTRAGYWKATGKDRKINAGSCKGQKKTLIYYFGRAPHGERTDWVMHEYRLDEEFEKKMNCTKSFVLCRIRRKGGLGPRNGEQYGAPVLEEDEGGQSTSHPLEEAYVLPSADSEILEGRVLEMPHAMIDDNVARIERQGGDDIDCFLQTLLSYEEQEQQPGQDVVHSIDDLLGFVNNLNDFAVMEPAHAGPIEFMDFGFGNMDSLCDLLHPTDNESVILEETLRLVSGQVEIPDAFDSRRALQEPSFKQVTDDVDNTGFIELADLEETCEEQGTLECSDIEELLCKLDNEVEIPMGTRLPQERLQVGSLQCFGDGQNLRCLQHLEPSGTVDEQLALEVLLDSSQGLSVLDNIYTRLLTSDDGGGFSDDLPSDFVLNSDQEGGFAGNSNSSVAHSHSHSSRVDEPSEAQLVRIDNLPGGMNLDMQGRGHLVASVSQEETKEAYGESVSINSITTEQVFEQPNSTAGLPTNDTQCNSSMGSLAPSPSSFARVISGFLGKVNALPASAAELPVELERCKPVLKDSSKYFAAESKITQSALTDSSSFSIAGAFLHFRVKLIDLEHIARTPEMELQLSISRTVSEPVSTKPCKRFTNGLSIFLFRMTTLAVILFCMFRGFCRSTRSAFF